MSRIRFPSWQALLPFVPATILMVVALAQLRLTRTEQLTPWKGGGFGMFSTNDDGVSRVMGVRISGPHGDLEVAIPDPLTKQAFDASILPSTRRLLGLGREIARIKGAAGVPVSGVRIAVWRMTYDPETLAARPAVVRDVLVRTSEPAR